MLADRHFFNVLCEATDFQVRSIAAQLFDKDGKPRASFMADPKGQLRQAFAKATETERRSKRNLSADAKARAGFDKRLKQYEQALKIARSAVGARQKRARKPAAAPGKVLKFPTKEPEKPTPSKPAGVMGRLSSFFRLASSHEYHGEVLAETGVRSALEDLRLLVEGL